jgi:hypothetical protein
MHNGGSHTESDPPGGNQKCMQLLPRVGGVLSTLHPRPSVIGSMGACTSPGFQALLQSVAMIAGTITTGRGYSHPDFGCNRCIIL